MSEDDSRLREAMRALRDSDERATPPFARVLGAAERAVERASPRPRRARVVAVAAASVAAAGLSVAAAAALLLVVWPEGPTPVASAGATDRAPLAFLLEPPSASVVHPGSLNRIEESW